MSGAEGGDPVYVYGVVPAGAPASGARLVERGPLAALVGDVPADRAPGTREDLALHQRVLDNAVDAGTVVPMRFGVVMPDEDHVREALLARHEAELVELLRALDGHVQVTVKAFYVGDALLRAAVASRPDLARRSARAKSQVAKLQLGEEVAALVGAQRERDERALLDRLAPFATDLVLDPAADERTALNAQLLVRRDRRAALDDAVAALQTELEGRLAFRYVGPLPPYSFADVALEDAAWA